MLGSAQGVEHFFGFWPVQPALAKLHSVERLEGVVDRQQLVFNHGAQQPNGAHDVDLLLVGDNSQIDILPFGMNSCALRIELFVRRISPRGDMTLNVGTVREATVLAFADHEWAVHTDSWK